MPAMIRMLTPEGLQPVDYDAGSLHEAQQYEPDDGIYTVTNTYNGDHVLKLDAHFDRMEDSARRRDIPLQLDRQRVRAALRTMIEEAEWDESRFRVTVPKVTPDCYILTVESWSPPSQELIENGVRCITAANSARHDAEAKTTDWMHTREKLKQAQPDDIYETFLLNENGHLLEGLSTNVYAVLGGELRTADEGVLKGISRQIVLDVAPSIIPVNKIPVHISQIPDLDEAFLTSSSRGIIPVIEIDRLPIGDGARGHFTRRLREAYDAWVESHLQPL